MFIEGNRVYDKENQVSNQTEFTVPKLKILIEEM